MNADMEIQVENIYFSYSFGCIVKKISHLLHKKMM